MRVVHLLAGRMVRIGAAGLVVAAALTACGGPGSSTVGAGVTPNAASTTGGPAARGGRFDPVEMQKIRDCLSAAGLSLPTPSGGLRSFNPSNRPSGLPSGTRPSGVPSRSRSGGFRGEGRGFLADPKVMAALEACGITLPTGRPTGGIGNPTTSPAATG